MCQISIRIPDAVLYDTHMNQEEATAFAQRVVALGYYTQSNVSIGYCAQIAGMTEEDFIKYLGANQVSIFQFDSREEFMEELKNASSERINAAGALSKYANPDLIPMEDGVIG